MFVGQVIDDLAEKTLELEESAENQVHLTSQLADVETRKNAFSQQEERLQTQIAGVRYFFDPF